MAQRTCINCGADISHLHGSAKCCLNCRSAGTLARTEKRRAQYPQRFCQGCGADISHRHGNVRWCERCRAYGPPRPTRLCRDCGADITSLHVLALRCEACRMRRVRACAACGKDITHLHGNTKICEECRAALPVRGQRAHRCRFRPRQAGTCKCRVAPCIGTRGCSADLEVGTCRTKVRRYNCKQPTRN